MTPAKPPVTTEDKCDRRWSLTRGAIAGIGVALAGSVALLLYSLAESRYAMKVGHAAEAAAGEVDHELEVHATKQDEHQKHLGVTLDEMKVQQQRILDAVIGGK